MQRTGRIYVCKVIKTNQYCRSSRINVSSKSNVIISRKMHLSELTDVEISIIHEWNK